MLFSFTPSERKSVLALGPLSAHRGEHQLPADAVEFGVQHETCRRQGLDLWVYLRRAVVA